MKTDIHPKYHDITFTCACGATFTAGSTIKNDFKTEICSKCHPFYTGKQKLVDTSGRVDKFMAKMKKAQAQTEKNEKKGKTEEATDTEETEKEVAETTEEKAEETEETQEETKESPEQAQMEIEVEEEAKKEEE